MQSYNTTNMENILSTDNNSTNMDKILSKDEWIEYFDGCGFDEADLEQYSTLFNKNKLRLTLLDSMNEDTLKGMEIQAAGDRMLILRWIKQKRNVPGVPTFQGPEIISDLDLPKLVGNVDSVFFRKKLYCKWANSKTVGVMFEMISCKMKNFLKEHIIVLDNSENEQDLLVSFIENKNPKSQFLDRTALDSPSVKLEVIDHCLNLPVVISKNILDKFDRNSASSSLEALGYQHIHRYNVIDTDASDSSINDLFSSSSEDILEEDSLEPDKKKRKKMAYKTCQLKIYMDCNDLLLPHDDNYTTLSGTATKLEILILCPPNTESICRQIASHLGLVFIEDMFQKIIKNAKNKNLLQNVNAKKSKVYPLIQNYIARSLMLGCNNITLTCNTAIFKHLNSNVKCMIFSQPNETRDEAIKKYVNMSVQTENDAFIDYLCAVSEIVDFTLKFKVSLPATYRISDKFYNCNVSGVGFVPLYILRFFAEKKMAEENDKKYLF